MKRSTKSSLPPFFVVIFFAIAGFVISFLFLNANYQQKPVSTKLAIMCPPGDTCQSFEVIPVYKLPKNPVVAGNGSKVNEQGNMLFHYNPAFLIWTMLILMLMSVSSGSLPVSIGYITELKRNFRIPNKSFVRIIIYAIIVALIMIVLPLWLRGYYTPHHIVRDFKILLKNADVIPGFSLATVMLSLPMVVTMFLVGYASSRSFDTVSTEAAAKAAIGRFNYLNSVLLSALQVLAIIVVLTSFCSAALGQSIKSVFVLKGFEIFPKEVSYAYGLFYALFLAMFYIPVYQTLKEKGKDLREQIILSSAGLSETNVQEREKMSESLEIKTSALDSLKMALTILSPLIASFIPEHLQVFK